MSRFEEILTADDVEGEIQDNKEELLELIPELKDMIGFDQKNPQHHLDVWNHTLLALTLSEPDFEIRLALLLHDIGKPHCYTEENGERHYKGHQIVSSEISRPILERLGYGKEFTDEICYLIENHDMPISKKLIETNVSLALKLYSIQKCDSLAHAPNHLDKRKEYLEKTKMLILNNRDCL